MDREAARFLPDFIYTEENEDKLRFVVVPIADLIGDMVEQDTVGAFLGVPDADDSNKEYYYLTTDWSRHQLLQLVGTKERWFESVSLERQAEELNARRHMFSRCMFRTMKADPILPIRTIRGLVSSQYSDYPNTEIMKSLAEICPADDTYCIRNYSGITDRCFYASVVIDEPMGIPGAAEGYPGVVVKNSEVGFTSLWVVPFLYLPKIDRMAIFEKRVYLRRVHRGAFKSVEESFKEAIKNASDLWKALQPKTAKLRTITFSDEIEATAKMRDMLTRLRATKGFQLSCVRAYQQAKHTRHDALKVFEAVCTACDTENTDTAYGASAVAGALLLSLTENL